MEDMRRIPPSVRQLTRAIIETVRATNGAGKELKRTQICTCVEPDLKREVTRCAAQEQLSEKDFITQALKARCKRSRRKERAVHKKRT